MILIGEFAELHNRKSGSYLLIINKLFIGLITFFFLFKSIFTYLNLEFLCYALIGLFLFINFILFVLKLKLPQRSIPALLFISVGIQSLATSFASGLFLIGIIGFIGVYMHMIYWVICFSMLNGNEEGEVLFNYYIRINIIFGFITAIFAVYQFFFDPTLFNVNPHRIYSDVDSLSEAMLTLDSYGGITRRATSFIGSPQNLGIYMGVMCGCIFMVPWAKRIAKIVLFSMFFAAGLLSGSGTFVVFLLMFFFFYAMRIQRVNSFIKIIIIVMILLGILAMQYIENLQNTILQSFYLMDRLKLGIDNEYNFKSFFSHEHLYHIIFGKGIGIADRLVEVVMDNKPPDNWIAGSESYLLKVFLELGVIGFLLFVIVYAQSMFYSYKSKKKQGYILFVILAGIVSNLMLTPSFTGLTMSFILWPFILYPILTGNNRNYASGQFRYAGYIEREYSKRDAKYTHQLQ